MPAQRLVCSSLPNYGSDVVPMSNSNVELTVPTAQYDFNDDNDDESEAEEPMKCWQFVFSIFSYTLAVLFGLANELLIRYNIKKLSDDADNVQGQGFAPLYRSYEYFFRRHCYARGSDCWNRPIRTRPASEISLSERHFAAAAQAPVSLVNMGSYDYLGYSTPPHDTAAAVEATLRRYGLSGAAAPLQGGANRPQAALEQLVAGFVGKEAAIVFGMGFATNSLNIPCLVDENSCVLGDSYNHASLALGAKLSGSTVRRFRHNDMESLEAELLRAVKEGNPRARGAPFSKILILVEGIYSMEGTVVSLPEIIRLKKRYKAYIYLDEAHSIGAMGARGRGVVDYYGCDPHDIDIMMGTFTKCFCSTGGYIAGSRRLIDYLRHHSQGVLYACAMSPVIAQQTISTMELIMSQNSGVESPIVGPVATLRQNTRYFRRRLLEMGFVVCGHRDSPVVPLLIMFPKLVLFSRMALSRGLAVVVVAFPATPLMKSRSRFCISAAHTQEMLDRVLAIMSELGDELRLKTRTRPLPRWCIADAAAAAAAVDNDVTVAGYRTTNGVSEKRACRRVKNGYVNGGGDTKIVHAINTANQQDNTIVRNDRPVAI